MKQKVTFSLNLKKNPYKGLYIVLEGIDGSGKTTQVEALKNYFRTLGKKVVITNEPTHNFVTGKLMRGILKSKIKVPALAFQAIYSADRTLNHAKIVEPALKKGNVVISHRSFWSALAHGVVDRDGKRFKKESFTLILVANGVLSHYHQFIAPDLTFYLDVSVDTALSRIKKMGKKGDIYENREKLTKILRAYKWVVANFAKNITIVDGENAAEQITKEIAKHVSRFV